MSLQHIQKNSPRLLPKPAKFEKNPPNGYRVIRKTKCGAGGAGGAGSSPIHKQASLAGRLMITHLAMEIHFQTTDHAVVVDKVPEQHIGTKYSKCNSLRVISHIIILSKSAITHSKVGQSSPNPKILKSVNIH